MRKSIHMLFPASRRFVAVLSGLLMTAIPVGRAQNGKVSLPGREMSVKEAFREIKTQTGLGFLYSSSFDVSRKVQASANQAPISEVMPRLLAGSGYTYTVDSRYVVLVPENEPAAGVPQQSRIEGTVVNHETGAPIGDAVVRVLGTSTTVTAGKNGQYRIEGLPAGNYVLQFSSPSLGINQFQEIRVAPGDRKVNVTLDPQNDQANNESGLYELIPDPENILVTPAENNRVNDRYLNSYGNAGGQTYIFTGYDNAARSYQPKVAVKTNLLYWATTSPNVSLEVYLGPRWTLDLFAGYNPWKFSGGASLRHWMVQPGVRYWFCNAFERHFVGLHGIYGRYNVGSMAEWSFAPKSLQQYTYKGFGYGAGVSYGYHLPMGKRWGWEFEVGAGWIHLDYDKYECNGCRTLVGHAKRDYFGLTKASVSLIFMIN